MNKFMQAMNNTAVTTNGMPTNVSSMSNLVDLFFKAGASRGRFENISSQISQAAKEDLDLTVRTLLWLRDAREGAGERQLFRDAIRLLIEENSIEEEDMFSILEKTAELGRFDDILSWYDTKFGDACVVYVAWQINNGNQLAAKWTPRKGPIFNAMRKLQNIEPKMLRKILVNNTNVVETQMCNKEFAKIDFSKVPSVAMSRYMTAFHRNAPDAFEKYKESLVKGETKINAGAVYPHTILQAMNHGADESVISAQWDALPNYMEGNDSKVLPVVDTSGSMHKFAGGSKSITCMDVAVSLGMYIAERNEGPFKDYFMTFSETPIMQQIKGQRLSTRFRNLSVAEWGFSTNLERVFEVLLKKSQEFNVPQSDMPETILILSDMQFNQGVKVNKTSLNMIKQMYGDAGYEVPQIVYWNIYDSNGVPATVNDYGVGLVSGFSPSIMKSILSTGRTANPEEMMYETIMNQRYDWRS